MNYAPYKQQNSVELFTISNKITPINERFSNSNEYTEYFNVERFIKLINSNEYTEYFNEAKFIKLFNSNEDNVIKYINIIRTEY